MEALHSYNKHKEHFRLIDVKYVEKGFQPL